MTCPQGRSENAWHQRPVTRHVDSMGIPALPDPVADLSNPPTCRVRVRVREGGEESRVRLRGFVMSLESLAGGEVLELTRRVARAAFPKGSLAIRLRDNLGQVFDDVLFAEAFPSDGRPAASPGALAMVSVMQSAERLSDRHAAEAVRPGSTGNTCWAWSWRTAASITRC